VEWGGEREGGSGVVWKRGGGVGTSGGACRRLGGGGGLHSFQCSRVADILSFEEYGPTASDAQEGCGMVQACVYGLRRSAGDAAYEHASTLTELPFKLTHKTHTRVPKHHLMLSPFCHAAVCALKHSHSGTSL